MTVWDCKPICRFLATVLYGDGQYDSAIEVQFPKKFGNLCLKLKFTQSILRITEAAGRKE